VIEKERKSDELHLFFSSSELDLELIRGSQLFQFSVESSII